MTSPTNLRNQPKRRRLATVTWIVLAGAVACSPPDDLPPVRLPARAAAAEGDQPQPETANWPLFRGDPQASGVAQAALPEQLALRWTFSADDGFESTPVVAGGTAYLGSVDGTFYAIELATGKERWRRPGKVPIVASAAVRDGRVYFGDVDGEFRCLEAESGKELWTFATEGEIDSAPNFHEQNVLFGSQDGRLYCLDAASGRLVWKFETSDQIRCFITIAGDRCFVAGCDAQLHQIGVAQGTSAAEPVDIHSPTGSSPAVLDDMVFVGTEDGTFFGIDWRSAKVAWQVDNPQRGGSFRSSAAVAPEIVVVGSRGKAVHAFDPKTGKQLWLHSTRRGVDASPVVVGDRVFVGTTDGVVLALNRATGNVVWQYEAGGGFLGSPAVADGLLLVANDDGQLFAFGVAP